MNSGFWKKLKKPIVGISPMSGITDEPFRLMFLKYGKPDVFWTEFVSADGLFSRGKEVCLKNLKFNKKERPIVAQIFGADPENIEKAARLVRKLGFDGVDINMGCPDRAIEKKGAGAMLIKNPELAKKIIRAAIKGAKGRKKDIPVSVKTRIGYEKNQINEWIPILLQENISALIIHFRTKKELYFGKPHWELAKEIVALKNKYAPKTLILGNGNVKSLKEAKKLAKENMLDGVLVGRALIGNPWFFCKKEPSIADRLNAILEHARIFATIGKEKHFDSIKKHFHAYSKGFRGAKDLREKLMKAKNLDETKKIIKDFKIKANLLLQ